MGRIQIQCYTLGPFAQNAYLLIGPSGRKAALVDPGLGSEVLLDTLGRHGLELEWIVNTHGHLDHTAGNRFFRERTGAPIIIHPADEPYLAQLSAQAAMFGLRADDSPPPDESFEHGKSFVFDTVAMEVVHTPGHTPGGVCLRFGEHMLVGDTLFKDSIGRTDLPGGSYPELIRSIRERLFVLPGTTICWPGHGPETTLAAERRSNPFVSDRAVQNSALERA